MKNNKMARLLILFCFVSTYQGCVIPESGFILDLAQLYHSKSVVIHLSNQCLTYPKVMAVSKVLIQQEIFVMAISQHSNNCSFKVDNTDLQILILDNEETVYPLNCLNNRKRSQKEPWIIYTNSSSKTMLSEKFRDAKLYLDDDILLATNDNNNNTIGLWELYRIGSSYPLEVLDFGFWDTITGLSTTKLGKWLRRGNLKGYHFHTTSMIEAPFVTKLEFNKNNEQWEFYGMFSDLLNLLAHSMNFTYTLTPPSDNKWGGQQPDGSWNGMIGLVVTHKVDFVVASTIQTLARSAAGDFTAPLDSSYQSLFIKNPLNAFNYTAYIEPLTYLCLGVIMIFAILSPIALFSISKVSNEKIPLDESYATTFSALLLLGSPLDPLRVSNRIAFLSILVSSALIYWHWEAMLVSYLAIRKIIMPFNSLSEMYTESNFRLAFIPSTVFEDTFRFTRDPLWKKIFEERVEPYLEEYNAYPQVSSDITYFIRNDYSTAVYDTFLAMSAKEEYKSCDIIATKTQYLRVQYAWPFQKYSPYLDIFNFYIKGYKEKGIFDALSNRHQSSSPVCPDPSGMPIEFQNCFTAFLALMAGMAVSFLIMILEFWFKPHINQDEIISPHIKDFEHALRYINTQNNVIDDLRQIIFVYERRASKRKGK